MKDQIVMSPTNAEIAIAIPLFRHEIEEDLGKLDGYSISLSNSNPLMYAIDFGQDKLQAFNAEWVEKNLEFLGSL